MPGTVKFPPVSLTGVATSTGVRLHFFFFQAEDGIRGMGVTGVQTCALPIWRGGRSRAGSEVLGGGRDESVGEGTVVCELGFHLFEAAFGAPVQNSIPGCGHSEGPVSGDGVEIGRASCRERVWVSVGAV